MKLSIIDVEFQNFLSYGNYKTSMSLSKLGPVLIVGDRSEEFGDFTKSNGAGKSTISTAILWALFGKTFSLPNPGDKVINWDSGKNCYVKLRTNDGWEITRTRKMSGNNELSIVINGEDKTLSTLTNTERFLINHYGLDFDIFTSSMFFGQFSKSFLELGDQKRKVALERFLNLDKLNVWASIAKDKLDKAENELMKRTTKLESIKEGILKFNDQKTSIAGMLAKFDDEKVSKIKLLYNNLIEIERQYESIMIPDIDRLRVKWDTLYKILDKLKQYESKHNILYNDIDSLKRSIASNASSIVKTSDKINASNKYDIDAITIEHQRNQNTRKQLDILSKSVRIKEKELNEKKAQLSVMKFGLDEWKSNAGTTCLNCKQTITVEHTEHMCEPIVAQMKVREDEISVIEGDIFGIELDIKKLPEITNPVSIDDAKRVNSSIDIMITEKDKLVDAHLAASEQIKIKTLESENIKSLINKTREQLEIHKPTMTIEDATKILSKRDILKNTITSIKTNIADTELSSNPHIKTMEMIDTQIEESKKNIGILESSKSKLHTLYTHLDYVKSAYRDRGKIKSYILTNVIPLLNKRIQYYLEAFDCEFIIEFTPALSITSSKWDYNLCSGGERKRIDMAMMFALYDLHIHMYGQQCNIMVLDEVDGRLDANGIQSFIDIIHNDFANTDNRPKPDTILIISHRPEMLDAFPSKIFVKKSGGFSHIESVM